MKRSRAPSSVAAAVAAGNTAGGSSSAVRGTTALARGSSAWTASPPASTTISSSSLHHGPVPVPARISSRGSLHSEESQPSMEVDVGMEDWNHGGGNSGGNGVGPRSGKSTPRRRSSRNSPASGSSSSSGGGDGGGSGSSSSTSRPKGSPEKVKRGSARTAARSPRSPRAAAAASVDANGAAPTTPVTAEATATAANVAAGGEKTQNGGLGGGEGGEIGSANGTPGPEKRGRAKRQGGGNGKARGGGAGLGRVKVEGSDKVEGSGGGERQPEAGGEAQPPKKKKKYVRNPETHKEYRTRMEAELAQARRMLEEGNAAMVDLARDYKRQQAIIEKYRNEDMSLQSFSQLTQSQPTRQQQQQQLQQLQLVQRSPGPQEETAAAGNSGNAVNDAGPVGCKPAPHALPLSATHEAPADPDPDMMQLSQDTCVGLSQASALSLSNLMDTSVEEPLSQATHWLENFKDSQEAWSLSLGDIFLPQGDGQAKGGAGDDGDDGVEEDDEDQEDEEQAIDSVEAVALAAEALSPSKQQPLQHQQHQLRQGCAGAAARGGTLSPRVLSPSSSASNGAPDTSPMHPPAPLLPVAAAGGRGGGASLPALLYPGGGPSLAAATQAVSAAGAAAGAGVGVVRVGVGCLVTNPKKPGCVLVGKRKGSIGAGTLALPGGHLEIGEEWPKCAEREVLEETGLEVETPTFSWVMNNPNMEGGRHYVTIFMLAAVVDPDKDPRVMEPDKCEGWSWETWKSLGDRLGVRKKRRSRGSCGGAGAEGTGGGRWGPGERLFHPLAALRSTTYDPFKGVL